VVVVLLVVDVCSTVLLVVAGGLLTTGGGRGLLAGSESQSERDRGDGRGVFKSNCFHSC